MGRHREHFAPTGQDPRQRCARCGFSAFRSIGLEGGVKAGYLHLTLTSPLGTLPKVARARLA